MNLKTIHGMMARGDLVSARAELTKLAEQRPNFALYQTKIVEIDGLLSMAKQAIGGEPLSVKPIDPGPYSNLGLPIYSVSNEVYLDRPEDDPDDIKLLLALARNSLIEGLYARALRLSRKIIRLDAECRYAYILGEQAAIEVGAYSEANSFFLSQPNIPYPQLPPQRDKNRKLPPQFVIPPILGRGNEYSFILERTSLFVASSPKYTKKASIIIPVYNRAQILANTLAALTHQTYPAELLEFIVVDDGSSDHVMDVIRKYESRLNLRYARQPDKGFRLAATRNLGLRLASNDVLIFFDADILPMPRDIEQYMQVMHVTDKAVLIGHRRYIDVSGISDDDIFTTIDIVANLPDINLDNDVADDRDSCGKSIDWRFKIYEKTNYLLADQSPFTKAAGSNMAVSRSLVQIAGECDEDFQAWGCEDEEFGYRLYNAGAYFIPMLGITSLHQKPLEKTRLVEPGVGESLCAAGHKITRELLARKCAFPGIRRYASGATFEAPKVSIYIPAYNAGKFIKSAVDSCLSQSFDDLEVCICDDGSTDGTLDVLRRHYSNEPKVRWLSQPNKGIGAATNTAISMCRGLYIAQLDSDDVLKADAVSKCAHILDTTDVDAVYADCEYIDDSGKYIRNAWCGGEFSREWMVTDMIATHFRMFRKCLWSRIEKCNERICNAVDLDLWLKINEAGKIFHHHEILYSYRWHGENTSIAQRKAQERNHLLVVENSFSRQRIDRFWMLEPIQDPLNPRDFLVKPRGGTSILPQDVIILIPTCEIYRDKADAVRHTWVAELTKIGFRYFFLMGNPQLDISQVRGDTIYVPCKDDYESLLLKLALGYAFLYRNLDFSYVYKIDDDCVVNVTRLFQQILPQLADNQYLGGATLNKGAQIDDRWHFGKCRNSTFDKPYKFDRAPFAFARGGFGYFLRRDVLPAIFEHESTLRKELESGTYSFEDVRISELLGKCEIEVKQLTDYQFATREQLNHLNWLLIYDIKTADEIRELYKLVKHYHLSIDRPNLAVT